MLTESSQSLTPSSDSTGMVLMWTGGRWKSLKTKTMSKFLRPNWSGVLSVLRYGVCLSMLDLTCTRSRCAISMSSNVITMKGGSVNWTKQSVDG